ncbi:MAG TPA: hypothetical protein VFN88_08780 [Caulobacteraceae bacterium]|nr:hypothetical protein [Caulobacteraceae bacterium]
MSNANVIRNLAHLQDSASTARVLNLLRVWRRYGRSPEYSEQPFFRNPILNRCLIIKHRLRRDEGDLFEDAKQVATKVVVPIDGRDLSLGGRSVLVGQHNYDQIMRGVFDEHWDASPEDRELLQILDQIPSFDPFLLREHLRRHNREPARCYFDISDADLQRMYRYVEGQVRKLVDLCYASADGAASESQSSRLVSKILSSKVDAETEPLRQVLRLEKQEYEEGVFCWKGFLYYKWCLTEAMPQMSSVISSIRAIKPTGAIDNETKAVIFRAREHLAEAMIKVLRRTQKSLKVYDDAFAGLVGGEPQSFRGFLLGAPAMFDDLGHQLGAINHVLSFWRFRFPEGEKPRIEVEELQNMLRDFEDSLAVGPTQAQAA